MDHLDACARRCRNPNHVRAKQRYPYHRCPGAPLLHEQEFLYDHPHGQLSAETPCRARTLFPLPSAHKLIAQPTHLASVGL